MVPFPAVAVASVPAMEEIEEAWVAARLSLLKSITDKTGSGSMEAEDAAGVLDLAEAYVWLTNVSQIQPQVGRG